MPGDDLQRKTHTDPFTPPSDPGIYIRTYAKDVAAITNAPPPPPVPRPEAPKVGNAPPVDGVLLPEHDPSPVDRKDAIPREYEQERVELSASDSDGIFTQPPIEPVPVAPLPQPTPLALPQEPAPEDRDAVLARLRERLATARVEPITAPVPLASPSAPEPTPAPIEAVKQQNEAPAPIHTFKSDFSDRIDTQEASTFTVLAAQADATQTPPKRSARRIPYAAIAGVIALVVGGAGLIGVASYFVLRNDQGEAVNPFVSPPSVVRADMRSIVTGEGNSLAENMRQAAVASNSGQGSLVVFDRVVSVETPVGSADALASGDTIVRTLGLSMPSILDRTVGPESVVGAIQVDGEMIVFLALSVSSYERSFAGMLAWEPRMRTNLGPLFGISPEETGVPLFIDTVTGNLDTRVLRGLTGQTLIVYGYPNKEVLIITRSEAAYRAVAARLVAAP